MKAQIAQLLHPGTGKTLQDGVVKAQAYLCIIRWRYKKYYNYISGSEFGKNAWSNI